jgi:hypothetical protein
MLVQPDQYGIIQAKFRSVSTFAGDNYRIKASIAGPINSTSYAARSGLITVWKKFSVEMHEMRREGSGAYQFPLLTEVGRVFSELFIRLDFSTDSLSWFSVKWKFGVELLARGAGFGCCG